MVILAILLLPAVSFADWNKAGATAAAFFKAMNNLNQVEAENLCAYQMKAYFADKLKPYFARAKKDPAKYKAHYYLFKKESAGGAFIFYTFIHIPQQNTVRYAVFFVENVSGSFKLTRFETLEPVQIVRP
jgi:hypothetical protein